MIHKLSDVASANIGKGTTIWQYCVILEHAVIGDNCNICCNVFVENDVFIGNNVTVKPGVQLWDGVRIEDNVFIGPNVTFTNDLVPRSKVYPSEFAKTTVCKGASIGANATIVGGITIEKNALIGAGAVITRNVPPHTVWYGNPASHKGYITENNVLIDLSLKDKDQNTYTLINGIPTRK